LWALFSGKARRPPCSAPRLPLALQKSLPPWPPLGGIAYFWLCAFFAQRRGKAFWKAEALRKRGAKLFRLLYWRLPGAA
jgi:hypothetical protein